jgi:CheY-like chemotaxis protein
MARQTILVTDHDSVYLEMVEEVLREVGYARVVCVAAPDAYPAALREQPDVILLDIHIGVEGEGWRFLDRLRLTAATRTRPVVICSTDPRVAESKAEWLLQHHCFLLNKPFDIEDLLDVLEPIIGPPATERT